MESGAQTDLDSSTGKQHAVSAQVDVSCIQIPCTPGRQLIPVTQTWRAYANHHSAPVRPVTSGSEQLVARRAHDRRNGGMADAPFNRDGEVFFDDRLDLADLA